MNNKIMTKEQFDHFSKYNGHKCIGFRYYRTKFKNPLNDVDWINREAVFSKKWQKENKTNKLLQRLFITNDGPWRSCEATNITNRDKVIAATVIQWLGTNVGFCWLCETLAMCGLSVVKTDDIKLKRNEINRLKEIEKEFNKIK